MTSIPLWVTLTGFAAPLLALAGSAVAYVIKLYLDFADRRRNQFFELMQFIDNKDGTIATKVAAVYELRRFPQNRDFIIRFCLTQRENVVGAASHSLIDELDCTLEAMRNLPAKGRNR